MDRPETGTVAGSHVGVECLDGVGPGQLTVLLVHVVGTGARVVADPDTEVLDLLGVVEVAPAADTLDLTDLTGARSSLDVLEVNLGVLAEVDD